MTGMTKRRSRKLDHIRSAVTEEETLRRLCREGTDRYRKALEAAGYELRGQAA